MSSLSREEKISSGEDEELWAAPADSFKAVWILDIRSQSL
jgi:hypothetical protein